MRIFILGLLLFAFLTTKAQFKTDHLEVQGSAAYIHKTFRLYLSPQIGFSKANHQVGIGPTIMISSASTASDSHNPKLIGVQGSYKWYPLEGADRLNFYFFNNLFLNRIVNSWILTAWNSNSQSYEQYSNKTIELLLQDQLGYGVEWIINNKMSIKQSIGAGFYFSTVRQETFPEEIPIPETNINGYDNFGFNYGLNLSFEYKF